MKKLRETVILEKFVKKCHGEVSVPSSTTNAANAHVADAQNPIALNSFMLKDS